MTQNLKYYTLFKTLNHKNLIEHVILSTNVQVPYTYVIYF
jgi:hypothetical protein